MNPNAYDFEVVWMTSGTRGTPHAGALARSNPGLICHTWTAPETGMDGWRNCDRNIREWWRANGPACGASRILFLEYDVLVTCDLLELFPVADGCNGFQGAALKLPVRDGRSFRPFEETDRLPGPMRGSACGIAPLAVAMLTVDALDAVADPAFDSLFAADIFSELRLATLVSWCGYSCEGHAGLAQVTCGPVPHPGESQPGIYHAVKGGAA